ncbi:hypothetical protein [Leptospira sarikeiensis]|uniref:Gluconate 2-dehydrogenase subunit 3 family protein n=1 Tax=Leptospira sarikeiensis TaxID=2484943 RepID=A0A4R9K845_9LEPT|nr:hypothetical protein [Leptospira sarikeiensis]TGL62777.1 hypothetical protein EHQ64_07655 [Leptospira sarikeiensis]
MSNSVPRFSRKTFLRLGLAGSGALVLGGSLCILNRSSRDLPKVLFFSESELEILASLSEAILPEGVGVPTYKEAKVLERLDEEFFFVDPFLSDDFKTLLLVLEYLPLFHLKFSRFSKLSIGSRRKFLSELNDSDSDIVRAVWANLRMPIFLMYYGHESTFKMISYDGPYMNPPEKLSESRIYYGKLVGNSDVG